MNQLEKTKYGKAYYEEVQSAEGEKAGAIWADANCRYEKLLQENSQLSEKIKVHTEKMIFPAIAAYQAILSADPEKAMGIMERAEGCISTKTGVTYRKMLRFSLVRRIFLSMFSKGTKSGFSEESGFINHFIRDEKEEVAFRIERCPYQDYCVKYGCPELTHIFCQNDINAYGNLPGIIFERHETLGSGGNCCDFHLYLKK